MLRNIVLIELCKLISIALGSINLPMNKSDLDRNAQMLRGALARRGYMRWWHSFVGIEESTGRSRTFFVEYFIINPALGGEHPILGLHPYFKKRGMKPSYVMIKAGVFPVGAADSVAAVDVSEAFDAFDPSSKQLHAFYPISSLKATGRPLVMQIGDCFYSENRIRGLVDVTEKEARHRSLMTDEGYMEWDLEVHKAVSCHTGSLSGTLFTALRALNSFWHAEGIRTFYQGQVILDGKLYRVDPESCCGYADKHWGRSYNHPWLQLSSGSISSQRTGRELKHSAFAVDGCCSRFFFFPLKRRLMIQLSYTGEDFEFFFARPGSFSRFRWKIKETNKRFIWHIRAQNKDALIKISGCCRKEFMTSLRYETPDGTNPAHPPMGGGAGFGTIQIFRRTSAGNQLIDTLSFDNALFEYGSRMP